MKDRFKNGVLMVVAIVVTAALIEFLAFLVFKTGAAVRVERTLVTTPFHPYLGWENAGNATFTGKRCAGRNTWAIKTDEWGHSITPHLNYDDPDVRVVVLGGSTMFGVGATDNETTIPSLLERELGERTGVRVEVYNLAVLGYTSFQEMLCLERFMTTERADIAVAISGRNDSQFALYEEHFGLLPAARVNPNAELVRSVERGELKVLAVGLDLLVDWMRRRSYAIDLLGKVIERVAPDRSPVRKHVNPVAESAEEIGARARRAVTNYAMTATMARRNGLRYYMFLQPTALTKRSLAPADEECVELVSPRRRETYYPFEPVFYDSVRACEKSYAFYDITDCLDEFTEPAYVDDCHYRDAAAEVIAKAVCDVIAPAVAEVAASRHGPPDLGSGPGTPNPH